MTAVTDESKRAHLCVKFGPNTEAMINVWAATPEELEDLVKRMYDVVDPALGFTEMLRAASVVTSGMAGPQVDPPSHSAGTATNPGPTCVHGNRISNSGVKNNKRWSGWFCPEPKDSTSKCAPIWNKD